MTRREKWLHWKQGHPLWGRWIRIRQQCGHVGGGKELDLRVYKQKGISVCDEWKFDYSAFERWCLDNGYAADKALSRIDKSKGFSPDNCWFTDSVGIKKTMRKCTLSDGRFIRDVYDKSDEKKNGVTYHDYSRSIRKGLS